MTFGLRIRPAADRDVDDLGVFIAQDSVDQAMRFFDKVGATYELICEAPKRWPLYGLTLRRLHDLRKRAVIDFPNHLIFYRIDADMVEIVRVLHGSRDVPSVLAATD